MHNKVAIFQAWPIKYVMHIYWTFQIATLVWLNKGDEHKDLLKTVTGARVAYELYNRVSREREIEKFEVHLITKTTYYLR